MFSFIIQKDDCLAQGLMMIKRFSYQVGKIRNKILNFTGVSIYIITIVAHGTRVIMENIFLNMKKEKHKEIDMEFFFTISVYGDLRESE